MSVTIQVTFDAHDPAALGEFWAFALGYDKDAPPAGFPTWEDALDHFGVPQDERNNAFAVHDPDGVGPRLFFQRVPEPKVAKNRVHLDLRAAPGLEGDDRMHALEARAGELVGRGATRVRLVPPDALNKGFIVMHDPEGNEFCLD
ncbi:VOC family protein [Propioniciclava coleopterorum]|uniref:VOC family protein n=1 Tax=Propioniciclava coleopterorum TaxID=2714937 RepID=A0A6G7YAM9_9ACTN|nr:VOC family protein [Propioniciclava coleopterorum]QIK73667.1 VOC family protein [Propioniciclava coleopterorum]